MTTKKTLPEREKELRSLLASPAGRAELEALAAHYAAVGRRLRPGASSLVTYILVCERERGMING